MSFGITQHLLTFFGLFGDEVDGSRAEDMSRRVMRQQLLAVVIVTAVFLSGGYGGDAALLIALSEIGFLGAVVLPRYLERPQLPLVGLWLLGQSLLVLAILAAGSGRAYLWGILAISIQFIGVIWTRKLTITATLVTIAMIAAAVAWIGGGISDATPVELIPAIVLLGMTAAAASTLRDLDYASRGNVLTDALTGLSNRVAMQQQMAAITTDGGPAAIVVLDLDHFKSINDIHGHAVGDAVLTAAAIRMERALGDDGTLYRYGGEEFVAILCSEAIARAEQVAERLRGAIAESPVGGLTVTVSGGLATTTRRHEADAHEIFRRADAALYRAKDEGRNRVAIASKEAEQADGRRELPIAIKGHQPDGIARPLQTGGRSRWLVGSVVQRDQLLAVLRGFSVTRLRAVNLVLVGAGIAAAPSVGWWPAVALAAHAVVLDPRLRRSSRMADDSTLRTESAALAEAVASMIWIAAAVALANEPALYLLALLVLPAFPVSAAYPQRAVVLLVGVSALLAGAAGFLIAPDEIAGNPAIVTMPVALVACVGMVGAAIGRSAVDHRSAAIIDPLTGLLNRAALDLRLPEISEHASSHRTPVTVIVGDLDHFKAINDEHGHATGDRVLAGVAERIREIVRSADAAYRVGGEEFVVLLPTTQTGAGAGVAERIREAIAREPVAGVAVTMSFGVAGSPGESFRYSEAFSRADAAMLAAKQAGRDRVLTAPPALRALAAA
ncbi:MAG: GGDEF domain-containing protein [Baekduia sp.]